MLRRLLTLTVLAALIFATAEARTGDQATDFLLEKGEVAAKGMKVPVNDFSESGKKKAQETADQFYADEASGRFRAEANGIDPTGGQPIDSEVSDLVARRQGAPLLSSERLYVFVSSSVPLDALRRIATDLDRLKDPNVFMVIRGFVGGAGKIGPTAAFVGKILAVDLREPMGKSLAINIVVDPLLFRRYEIGRVPALAYVQNVQGQLAGESEGIEEKVAAGDAWIVYGDASIPYSVELLARESGSPSLRKALTQLKPSRY